jgi:hypothetical protein
MKKFMILYRSASSAVDTMATATEDEMKAGMEAWMKWKEEVESAGVKFEFGMPLQGRKHVEAGEVMGSESDVSGYSTMEAESIDDVLKHLKDHPHLKVATNSIEVLEFMPMPGM